MIISIFIETCYMRPVYIILFTLFFALHASAQVYTITGTITDQEGKPVAFASIYEKNTTKGTSANTDGEYEFKLETGHHELVFKAIGYQQVNRTVVLDSAQTIDVKMVAESYQLKEVVVRGDGEDPAYEIIRSAIRKRKTYLTEVDSYSADVYIKGIQKLVDAPEKFLGRDVSKVLELDSNKLNGILYLSESESKFNFQKPDRIREVMVSSRISGRNNAFSFNKASDLIVNFYENLLRWNGLSNRGFVSPVADNALFYYRYKLLGTTVENGMMINKIQVIPRRESDPVFRGNLYIQENSWRIHNAKLYLTKRSGINFIDTLNISQQFFPVEKIWMPSAVNFSFNGNVLGFKFDGYFTGVYRNYNINPNFNDQFFTGEILRIDTGVNKKNADYWQKNRPVPLTEEEQVDYRRKDSIALRKESKPYLDSLEKANNKVKAVSLFITGYRYNNRFYKRSIAFDGILPSLFFNTVEGFGFKYGVTFRKDYEYRRTFSLRPEVRYGFVRKNLNASLTANYFYDPIKRANINVSVGSDIVDLNNLGSIPALGNSVNSLLFELNRKKFYLKQFATLSGTRELAKGLMVDADIEYAQRKGLQNVSNFTLFNTDSSYYSNNPFTREAETELFPANRSLSLNINAVYTFNQQYITRPDGRFYEPSKYPAIRAVYRKGIKSLFGSDVDYDFISAEVFEDRINLGLLGYSSFSVSAGKFLNRKRLFYTDYKHFRGNQGRTFNPALRNFHFLDYYLNSTNRQYVEAHGEHNFSGFLFNKVPLLRRAKLEEIIGVSYLTNSNIKQYAEFYFGIQRFIFRVDYAISLNKGNVIHQGIKFYYGF